MVPSSNRRVSQWADRNDIPHSILERWRKLKIESQTVYAFWWRWTRSTAGKERYAYITMRVCYVTTIVEKARWKGGERKAKRVRDDDASMYGIKRTSSVAKKKRKNV